MHLGSFFMQKAHRTIRSSNIYGIRTILRWGYFKNKYDDFTTDFIPSLSIKK